MPESRIDDLNPEQLRAATAGEDRVYPIAGAGTGKTKTLAARVASARVAGDRSGPDHASYVHAQGFGEMLRRARRALGETGSRTLRTVYEVAPLTE